MTDEQFKKIIKAINALRSYLCVVALCEIIGCFVAR